MNKNETFTIVGFEYIKINGKPLMVAKLDNGKTMMMSTLTRPYTHKLTMWQRVKMFFKNIFKRDQFPLNNLICSQVWYNTYTGMCTQITHI